MAKVRLTKEFKFEASHALKGYDGLCKNIHGHSYKMFVTVVGEPITDKSDPKYGMVIDFGDLKNIVNKLIVKKYDHSLILNEEVKSFFKNNNEMFERIHFLPYQPTCENMVIDFAEKIKKELPENVKLYSIKLYETANSFAEWVCIDNE